MQRINMDTKTFVVIIVLIILVCIERINAIRDIKDKKNKDKLGQTTIDRESKRNTWSGQFVDNEKSNEQNDNPDDASIRTKVFIAHSVDEATMTKWENLKSSLEVKNYDVFDDKNSNGRNDIEFCKDNINISQIIVILVGDERPFMYNTGVFYDEIEHVSGGLAKGKRLYICSYGIENPLQKAINKIEEPKNGVLERLKNHAKTHCYNYDSMKELAEEIDNDFKGNQNLRFLHFPLHSSF